MTLSSVSRENVELIRAGYEALARGEIDPVLEASDPAVELHVSDAYFDAPHTYRGYDGYRQLFAAQTEVFEGFRVEPEEFLDAGDQVLAIVWAGGRGRKSQAETMGRFGHLFTLRNGKIVRFREFKDPQEAMRAAGLKERADAARPVASRRG